MNLSLPQSIMLGRSRTSPKFRISKDKIFVVGRNVSMASWTWAELLSHSPTPNRILLQALNSLTSGLSKIRYVTTPLLLLFLMSFSMSIAPTRKPRSFGIQWSSKYCWGYWEKEVHHRHLLSIANDRRQSYSSPN